MKNLEVRANKLSKNMEKCKNNPNLTYSDENYSVWLKNSLGGINSRLDY